MLNLIINGSKTLKYLSKTMVLVLIIFLSVSDSLYAQHPANTSEDQIKTELEKLKKAENYLKKGETVPAFYLLNEAAGQLEKPGFRFASLYLDLVVKQDKKDYFGAATNRFLMALSQPAFSVEDSLEIQQEMDILSLILENSSGFSRNLENKTAPEMAQYIQQTWISLDPTPTINANQRLIEHRERLHNARYKYPDPEADHGMDARGVAYLKYGEPDIVYDRPFNFNRGELHYFVTEFQEMTESMSLTADADDFDIYVTEDADSASEATDSGLNLSSARAPSGSSAIGLARVTDNLVETIGQDPFHTSLKIWIYGRFNSEMDENLILYFKEGRNDVYERIRSLDDWIPRSLYSSGSFNGNFTPALPLQYLAYQRVMFLDRQLMDTYNNLQNRIFNHSIERSATELRNMARNVRANHQQIAEARQLNAPAEYSTETEQIPHIPLQTHQYRSFNDLGQPVFVTFIKSLPTIPFLNDFAKNQEELLINETDDAEHILEEISNWYHLEQGVELFDETMQRKGRLRGWPQLHLDIERELPSVMIADVPFMGEGTHQTFYSKLFNAHPETAPHSETVFPEELRGLGKKELMQEDHIATTDELMLSDLIIGYGRLKESGSRFPFLVKHDKKIPEDENPVIYFNVHGLTLDELGFTNFEVDYRFETDRRSFLFFRRTPDELSGTLEFSTSEPRFSDSLEFDNLPLREGTYTLYWTLKDLNSNSREKRELEINIISSE